MEIKEKKKLLKAFMRYYNNELDDFNQLSKKPIKRDEMWFKICKSDIKHFINNETG